MAEEETQEAESTSSDTDSGTGTTPENNIQHEETMVEDVKIENSVSSMKEKYGDKFNAEGYKQALKEQKEKTGTIEGVNVESFIKDDSKNNSSMDDGKNNGYSIENKDGKFYARGTNGKILQGNSFEDINDKVCEDLAKSCRDKGREAKISFHSDSEEEKKIFSRNALLKHDITITNGWPQDKEFWKNLKEEYLKNPDHALKDWEKMTRKIPDDVMNRTKEESERNKKLNDADLLKEMRMGRNPNLETKEPETKAPASYSQNQNKNMEDLARLKAMKEKKLRGN